jgi:5-formyltetrahydrofolate cyclo-ligase
VHGSGRDELGAAGGDPSGEPGQFRIPVEPLPAGDFRPARGNMPVPPDLNTADGSLSRGAEGGELGGAGPSGPAGAGELAARKAAMRAEILAARRAMPAARRAAAGREIRDALLELPELQMAGTVAAYASVGTEPDTHGLVFALWKRGSYVLLPVLLPDGDLDWASYEGPESLAAGPRGLLEPTEPRRGVTAITSADLLIVPALAVDQSGRRLGRGGGSYDRALARIGAGILTVAPLYQGELVSDIPAGPHDQSVRLAAVAGEGISRLR